MRTDLDPFLMDNKILELCLIYSMFSITGIEIIVIHKHLMSSICPINTILGFDSKAFDKTLFSLFLSLL